MVDNAFGEVAERLRRSTVKVHAGQAGSGSGVIWNADGQVVTNAHVLREGRAQVELWNGRQAAAHVLRRDRRRDIALLQVQAEDLLAAAHGDSDILRTGELVIAVGNPFGFTGAVSTGIVHSVTQPWIVSDVRLAPGNSGGPLANARGEVVGINTMIAGGLACAIASNCVVQFLSHAHLGVTVRPMHLGLMVLEVAPQSPADRASLRPGDVLVSFHSLKDLEEALSSTHEGRLEIEFRRGAGTRSRRVVAQVGLPSARAA
ncbi:MAG TPA: trypsin-like peptidase domain-containing protein [Bryobacteraceae bacterium]